MLRVICVLLLTVSSAVSTIVTSTGLGYSVAIEVAERDLAENSTSKCCSDVIFVARPSPYIWEAVWSGDRAFADA